MLNRTLKRLIVEDKASNAVEYGLIAALVALALIVAFETFGQSVSALFDRQTVKVDGVP
jgi:Flp pilus assembly pilin Flp